MKPMGRWPNSALLALTPRQPRGCVQQAEHGLLRAFELLVHILAVQRLVQAYCKLGHPGHGSQGSSPGTTSRNGVARFMVR